MVSKSELAAYGSSPFPEPEIEDKTETYSQSGHDKANRDLNWDNYSIQSHELFEEGKDDIIYEGELMKFKPGLTVNFIPRYVQISRRAFRYFKNKSDSYAGRPIASIRKAIIRSAEVIEVNKGSYLKPGSDATQAYNKAICIRLGVFG